MTVLSPSSVTTRRHLGLEVVRPRPCLGRGRGSEDAGGVGCEFCEARREAALRCVPWLCPQSCRWGCRRCTRRRCGADGFGRHMRHAHVGNWIHFGDASTWARDSASTEHIVFCFSEFGVDGNNVRPTSSLRTMLHTEGRGIPGGWPRYTAGEEWVSFCRRRRRAAETPGNRAWLAQHMAGWAMRCGSRGHAATPLIGGARLVEDAGACRPPGWSWIGGRHPRLRVVSAPVPPSGLVSARRGRGPGRVGGQRRRLRGAGGPSATASTATWNSKGSRTPRRLARASPPARAQARWWRKSPTSRTVPGVAHGEGASATAPATTPAPEASADVTFFPAGGGTPAARLLPVKAPPQAARAAARPVRDEVRQLVAARRWGLFGFASRPRPSSPGATCTSEAWRPTRLAIHHGRSGPRRRAGADGSLQGVDFGDRPWSGWSLISRRCARDWALWARIWT